MRGFLNWIRTLSRGYSLASDSDHSFGLDRILKGNPLISYLRGVTGSGLTAAQIEANEFSASEAQKQRDWETELANTTYQRTVNDLKAAGLNPALAMNNGASVPTPSGSAASSVSPAGANLLELILQMKSLGIQKQLADANTQKIKAETQGIELDNEWKDTLNQLHVDSQLVVNRLNEVNINQVNEKIDEIRATVDLLKDQAATEQEHKLYLQAERFFTKEKTNQIVAMLPYNIALTKAQTDEQRASAATEWIMSAKERGLIEQGYYNDLVLQARSQTKLLGHQAERAAIDEQTALYNYFLHTGEGIQTKAGQRLFHGLQNLSEVTGGLGAVLGIAGLGLGVSKVGQISHSKTSKKPIYNSTTGDVDYEYTTRRW